jgi:hypothetical protein
VPFSLFISPASVNSRNVRNEIDYALTGGKRFVAVHLTETQLPPGLALRMGDIQAILRYRVGHETYLSKLIKSVSIPDDVRPDKSLTP